jgi:hypothetical protein
LRLQALKLLVEVTHTRRLNRVDVELIRALHLVHADLAMSEDGVAFSEAVHVGRDGIAPHGALDSRAAVLEGEVDVPARRTAEVADLALHPEVLQAIVHLEHLADVARQFANADGLGLLREKAVLHGEIVAVMGVRSK